MIDEYLQNPQIALAILLLDIRRIPSEDDLLMYDYFKTTGIKTLIVLTKADKLSKNQILKQKKLIKQTLPTIETDFLITYSTQTKENQDKLWEILEKAVENNE